jgi:hypothetical protein
VKVVSVPNSTTLPNSTVLAAPADFG